MVEPGQSTYYIGGGGATGDLQDQVVLGLEAAVQSLNTIVQLHFEKTLEKKRAVDAQKQELWRLFLLFFLFLALVLSGLGQTGRIQCRHVWAPLGLLSLAHLAFYAAVAHHLRCINGFRYQRRCHKLTLALATERLKMVRSRYLSCGGGEGAVMSAAEVEVPYQEPPDSYLGKFKRSWAMHFGFLLCTFGFMVASSVVILCF
ncbi:transmembrane protein [Rhynchospora pubera]|uniref:Transmembrane protein n=1 Tax=Rhynchospora pubera TaxID=906938 RepID=A0AAV8GNP7_9POAL|nr:transmembrane protein [Rhynchospora pubera]